ncbi:non-receptor tyrosine-protein kinase TNK1 isoform X6 [Corythoichthys intestinalis]|uniref:non-receptor tyrosine-protein kinase TNK1 isoform X6 n=1 Tax=Corythoichthys intestinalis TaxID=161448 RepID=UPI0025A4D8B4|nr:non-receptor tyrosine-protein kinase TNK1 isoform X6 [Corythoichthys intestinalis]
MALPAPGRSATGEVLPARPRRPQHHARGALRVRQGGRPGTRRDQQTGATKIVGCAKTPQSFQRLALVGAQGVRRSRSRRRRRGARLGRRKAGPSQPDPGQRADSRGEAGLRFLRGGQKRRVAHPHRASSTGGGEIAPQQHVPTGGDLDGLFTGSDQHAVTGPPAHHSTVRCGAHASPQNGDRAGPVRLAVRYAALSPVRVPVDALVAVRRPDSGGHGLPGDAALHPPRPGRPQRPAGLQGDCEARRLRSHERPEPGRRPLRHVRAQAHPFRLVRPGKSPRGLFLAFLRRVDVRRHPLGDVHLLRRALARSLGKTGKRASARPFRIRLDRPALSQILWRVEREGERLEKPPDSPREMYAIMRKCWACNPSDRPNFAQLATMVTEAKPAEVRAAREFAEARKLALAPGDIVTLVEHGLELSEWRGQNQRTLSVGWFPPGVVVPPVPAPSGEPAPDPVSDFISAPMRGSLHHAAHGDVRPDRSWGTPDNLEESVDKTPGREDVQSFCEELTPSSYVCRSSGGFRQATTREKEPSNLQKMSGFSRSLESVLSGRQCPGPPSASRGRAYPVVARSVVVQQDPRRFSEASLLPPPRPPPPHLKRSNWKPQRRPATVPPPQPPGGANLVKMSHLARSTPQLDEPADARERLREREIPPPPPLPPAHLTRDALISQVMDAVHGVTIEEARAALQRNDWNPPRAEQQLKASARKRRDFWGQFSQTPKRDEGPRRSVFDGAFVGTIFRKRPSVKVSLTAASLQLEQLYSLSLCSKEDCLRILARYQWNLQLASRYLIRWSRDDRSASAERRV